MTDLELKEEWYKQHNCTHAHCPYECEHPQPFICSELPIELACGKCWWDTKTIVKMIPCIPESCNE
jgi:hypothetical protein